MTDSDEKPTGLAEALEIARGGAGPLNDEGSLKVIGFLLGRGECDAWISAEGIAIRYSWLKRKKPSTYFMELAPGIIRQLMYLGGIEKISGEAIFPVGPGTSGSGGYAREIRKKWVRIIYDDETIHIRVRDKQESLPNDLVYDVQG